MDCRASSEAASPTCETIGEIDVLPSIGLYVHGRFPQAHWVYGSSTGSAMKGNANKRKYPRIRLPKSALVAWKLGSQKTVSPVENLALGGLFIRTKNPANSGTMLQLVFNTPQGEVRVRAVVRNVAPDGMGVAIVSMEQEDRGRLDQWLKQLGTAEEAVERRT